MDLARSFDFEFGDDLTPPIKALAPAFCKVLVRYNLEVDAPVNGGQAARLRRLSEALAGGPSRFMFELLVPATPQQLKALGANVQHVRAWLATGAGLPGFIGFAVGRVTFWEPLIALRNEKITRAAAVAEIARRYRQWVDVFELAKTAAGFSDAALEKELAGARQGRYP